MRIIGYTYLADMHCPACTEHKAAIGILKRQPPLQMGTDEHGIALDLVDHQSNPVRPIFSTDEVGDCPYCGDCLEEL
jgi:hypothetical protein